MIEDFGDRHKIRAVHSLCEFVVINEDKLTRNGLQEIAFCQDSSEVAVLIQHREGELRREGEIPLCLFERGFGSHRNELVVKHFARSHGAACQQHRCGCVVRRTDDHYASFLRRLEDCLINLKSSGDDYRMDFLLNCKLLDVMAVAHDEDRFLVVEFAQPPLE